MSTTTVEPWSASLGGPVDGPLPPVEPQADPSMSSGRGWRLIRDLYLRGELDRALETAAGCDLSSGDDADAALVLAWTASCHARRGDPARTRSLVEAALARAEASGDDRALAAAHCAAAQRGPTDLDPEGRAEHLVLALAHARRAGDPRAGARALTAQGSALLEQGDYAAATALLDEAIDEARSAGAAAVEALAVMNRGLAHWCRGGLDEARDDYDRAVRLYRRAGSREVCYALVGLGDVHREQGDLALARAAYEEGLQVAERTGDRQGLVPGLYQLAKVLVDDDPERAEAAARRAVGYGWPDLAWAHNATGWVALCRGDRQSASRAAAAAGAAARAQRDRYGLAESLEIAAMAADNRVELLLLEARATWRRVGNPVRQAACELALAARAEGTSGHAAAGRARRTLRRHGVGPGSSRAAGLLRFVTDEAADRLVVRVLGRFEVTRGGDVIGPAQWRSHKARDVLKLLVARHGRPVPREQLMEALWPGAPVRPLRNRLSVALCTLRTVLDPDRRHQPDHVLTTDGDLVGLALSHLEVDAEVFAHEARSGLALRAEGRVAEAAERLWHAEELTVGDAFAEDPYADWADELREEVRATYADVAHALADDTLAAGDPTAAAPLLRRLLGREPYDERAHLQLIDALATLGRHGDAARAHDEYARRMHELGVAPRAFGRSRPAVG